MKIQYLRMVRRAFRALRHRRLRNRPWWQKITKPLFARSLWVPCRDSVATGLAIGLFFSMMLMPMQMLPAALLAMRAKANVPFAIAACWVTNPLTAAPVLYAQFRLGDWMRETLGVPMPDFLTTVNFVVPKAGHLNAASYILGMLSTGVLLALCAYPLVHLFGVMLPHYLPVRRRRVKKEEEAGARCPDDGLRRDVPATEEER
jgi:uncharacterized protein (DUF2062 family)